VISAFGMVAFGSDLSVFSSGRMPRAGSAIMHPDARSTVGTAALVKGRKTVAKLPAEFAFQANPCSAVVLDPS